MWSRAYPAVYIVFKMLIFRFHCSPLTPYICTCIYSPFASNIRRYRHCVDVPTCLYLFVQRRRSSNVRSRFVYVVVHPILYGVNCKKSYTIKSDISLGLKGVNAWSVVYKSTCIVMRAYVQGAIRVHYTYRIQVLRQNTNLASYYILDSSLRLCSLQPQFTPALHHSEKRFLKNIRTYVITRIREWESYLTILSTYVILLFWNICTRAMYNPENIPTRISCRYVV